MRKLTEYPILSLAERDRRWALTRAEMKRRNLDCLVLIGWPAMWDFNIANARYLCPIGGNAENNIRNTSAVRKHQAGTATALGGECNSGAAKLPANKRRDQREPGQVADDRPGHPGEDHDDRRRGGHQLLAAPPTRN
jgi:hypothetical protein